MGFRVHRPLAATCFLLLIGACAVDQTRDVATISEPIVVCAKGPKTLGFDVSKYQSTVDFAAAKAAGYQFAFIRTGDGATVQDVKFDIYWPAAKAAGVLRGAYHFFRPASDPLVQADYVISKVGVLSDTDLPVVADVEADNGVAPAELMRKLQIFLDRIEAGTKKVPIIYTGTWFWNPKVTPIGSPNPFSDYPLWISHYTTACPNLPNGWNDWLLHQYTDVGVIPGVPGTNDVNYYNGTLADLVQFAKDARTCGTERCNGRDDDCDGAIDEDEVCELEAIHRDPVGGAPPSSTDVNGDGKADVCGRGTGGFVCYLSDGTSFGTPTTPIPMATPNGWDGSSLRMGDVTGDGKADACIRHADGVHCWPGTDTGFGAEFPGPAFSDANGWAARGPTMRLADINGDAKEDICALAVAGVVCYLSTGNGFGPEVKGPAWTKAEGFDLASHWGTLRMGDVDADGRDDVCARTSDGIECFLSSGNGFPTRIVGPPLNDGLWSALPSWSTLRLADVNGDKRADFCARSSDGLRCWLSAGNSFGAAITVAGMTDANGWSDPANYRTLRAIDFDGDGNKELCARADAKVVCWDGIDGTVTNVDGPAWSDADGWAKPEYFDTIRAGDFDGDKKEDLCARGSLGWRCAPATGTGFGATTPPVGFTDADGWSGETAYGTILFGGPVVRRALPVEDAGVPDAGADSGTRDAGPVQDASNLPDASAEDLSMEGGGCSVAQAGNSLGGVPLLGTALAFFVTLRRRRDFAPHGARQRTLSAK